MKNKRMKYFIITMLFFFFSTTLVNASNIIDFSKRGSIEITLYENENNRGIEDVEVTIYQVASVINKDYNLSFDFVNGFDKCGIELDNLSDNNLVNKTYNCLKEDTPNLRKTTDLEGKIVFDDLELGIYLIVQTNKIKGYSTFEPFFVVIPEYKDNNWNYDVIAKPKTDIYREFDLKVVKVWNSISANLPKSVTIQLYKSDKLIDTVVLNDDNDWYYTWTNIEKSDEYSVKEINVPSGYTPSYKYIDNVFTITNTDLLPKTGQTYFPIIILLSLGVIFILLGFIQLKRDNKNE